MTQPGMWPMGELGRTGEPTDLIPGDPGAIDKNVIAFGGRAGAMERAGAGLKQIDNGAWQGDAADAFRDKFGYEPARWTQAADAFERIAKELSGYADTLRWAQGQAAVAIRLWDEGQRLTQQAEQAHGQAVADANAHADAGTPVVPVFSDPGVAKRQEARDILQRARQQLTEAGDRAAEAIRDEADKAPKQSGWDEFWGGVGDVAGFIGDVGVGLWDGLSGTGEFLWELSPHHLFEDPHHYAALWNDLTAAAAFAVEHPLEFGKQMISWERWAEEPGRALGNTAFGLVPVAGVVAKAKKLRTASKIAPNVKPHLHEYFRDGGTPKASELAAYAEAQGWRKTQTPTGPPKYFDENGIERLCIKKGTSRAAGSETPHVAIRDANGQRIDPFGNPVTRRDPGNHTDIDWDLD